MKRSLVLAVVLGLTSGPAWAATTTVNLTVAAGPRARTNVPVCVPIGVLQALADQKSAVIQARDGKLIGQLTGPGLMAPPVRLGEGEVPRELHFILPHLAAGQTLPLKVVLSTDTPALTAERFRWHDTPDEFTELRFGKRPVLRYMYKALDTSTKESRDLTFKVYHHLYDPSGERLVTKGPPGGLYPHHRGLFFGFNKVTYGNKKADVWHCTGDAYQSHELFREVEAGPVLGRHRVEIAWHGPGREIFAREERELTVYNVPGGELVEFASVVRSTMGKLRLDGDPQHAGFHFRAAQEVAARFNTKEKVNKDTYFLRPDGHGRPGETRNWDPKTRKGPVNLPWDAMSFVLGNRRYTVAYLDTPTNPKEARFSERDYGRFGSYFEYNLDLDHPLRVDYRIWLQTGEMTGAQVAALDTDFVQPPEVTLK